MTGRVLRPDVNWHSIRLIISQTKTLSRKRSVTLLVAPVTCSQPAGNIASS